ncbi:MAG: hypothetical protein JNK15_03165 [Planctomycetes bacterium]|nr:hypothetical protein [Planctomycetota bacterium]
MIRVLVRQGVLGQQVDAFDVPAAACTSARSLLQQFASLLPRSVPITVAVNGARLRDEQLDDPIPDGQQVVLLPTTGDVVTIIVTVLIQVAVAAAVNYVAQQLAPRPKPQGVAQERGDESSSTYAWDGLTTNYGPGLPIPWVYGRHAVGGQVIWSDVIASRANGAAALDDRLRMVLSLCDGPIYRFGDILAGSIDGLGGLVGQPAGPAIPSDLRINDTLIPPADPNPGVRVWLRPGTKDQPPLPAPFTGVATTETLNVPLTGVIGLAYVHTIADASDLAMIRAVVAFPSGLYAVGPNGQPVAHSATFTVGWRLPGQTGPGTSLPTNVPNAGAGGPFLGYHAVTWSADASANTPGGITNFPTGLSGPIELLFFFSSVSGTSIVNAAVLRELTTVKSHTLRYPGEVLLAIEVAAGSRFSGGRPQVYHRIDGALVRVWDATNGWSPRCWEVPAAPHNFNTHPPGRNPAWCLLDFLLNRWGLGRYLTEDKIDLPAFRRWAAFCDSDPNPGDPWGEPSHCVDVVGDQPRTAWEWVLLFCSTGRATPVMRNGKISVVYQYRDAHGDAGITVPAKESLQLLTSGNCEALEARLVPKRSRATILEFQFLNEETGYAQDVYPVEDDESTFNDPTALRREQTRVETIQAFGVTRESQLFREGRWRHRIARLVDWEITGRTGPWALAAEVGDLVDVEHELLRPFATDVPLTQQVTTGGTATTTIEVDHHLTGSGLQFVGRGTDGKPKRSNITSYVNALVGGKKRSTLTLATAVTVATGATCVVGKIDKLTETYELVSITQGKDLVREFRAIQWTPTAYDPITRDEFQGILEPGDIAEGTGEDLLDNGGSDTLPPEVYGIRVSAQVDGSHLVTWARPASKAGTWARVYVRPADLVGAWVLVAGTELSEVAVRGLAVGTSYVVSVALENRGGDPVPPDLGDQITVLPEEFPPFAPPAVTNARAVLLGDGVQLEWNQIEQRDLDTFEVRCGSNWPAAAVLVREKAPRVVLADPPAGPVFLIAARSRSGLYGGIAQVTNPNWTPRNTVSVLDENDLAPSPAGSHSGTAWNSTAGVIELAAGQLTGTYEGLAQDIGYQAPFFWQVRVDREEFEDLTVADLAFACGSGEGRWRRTTGRPASAAAPGLGWHMRCQDLTGTLVVDLPRDLLARGFRGVTGTHTRVLVESRFYVSGVWTAYAAHVDRVVVASRMQVRLTLGRRSLTYRARVPMLTYRAFL